MSYSIYINGYDDNVTWNVMPMFIFAFTGRPWRQEIDSTARAKQRTNVIDDAITQFRELDGRICGDVLPFLEQALLHMRAEENREAYEAMNAENGWGTHGSTLCFLRRLVNACREYPAEKIDIE